MPTKINHDFKFKKDINIDTKHFGKFTLNKEELGNIKILEAIEGYHYIEWCKGDSWFRFEVTKDEAIRISNEIYSQIGV